MTSECEPPARAGRSLIVHADDFGISDAVNRGILDAHLGGVLTSTSIMASAPAFDQAIDLCKAHPSLDVGIHLTLVEERPLLPPSDLPSLVGDDGRFHGHATVFARKYAQGKIALPEVRRELAAQVAKVVATGTPISHLDSHQHLHMFPGVLDITLDLAREHAIPYVRFPREAIRPYMLRDPRGLSRVAQQAAVNLFCRMGEKKFAGRTDHFVGFYYGGNLGRRNLREVLRHLPATGVCELMCHPGRDDPDVSRDHWGYRWAEELEALMDPELADILQAKGVALASYRNMNPGANTA